MTWLLFLALFLRLLKTGGRAAVVVPDGVLFGSSKAHQELRKLLVEKHKLEGVLKLPSGVFRPYAGVSTAVLFFTLVTSWLLVRAWGERATPEVLDLYPYATTSPAFVTIAGKAITSARDADYFLSWIERLREAATAHPDYNSEAEKHATLETIDQATRIFQAQQKDRPAQH